MAVKHLLPSISLTLTLSALIFITTSSAASGDSSPSPYTNHTVGGGPGWTFSSHINSSATNYSSWVSSQTFSLGDYLIFKARPNATVVQTMNATAYDLCGADEDSESTVYTSPKATGTVEVPLTKEGENYFFSGDGGGMECEKGMKFAIKVQHGQGLPPSLNQPPPPPYKEPSPPPEESKTTPATSNQGEQFRNGASRGRHVGLVALFFSTAVGWIFFWLTM